MRTLQAAGDRLGRLHGIAIRLAGAVGVREVAEVIVEEGTETLGADGGSFSIVDVERGTIDLQVRRGAGRSVADSYRSVPIDTDPALTDVARSGSPIYVTSRGDRRDRFPGLADLGAAAFVLYPVEVRDSVRAVIAFGFIEAHEFTSDEQDLIATIVGMSAQALQRAALHDDAEQVAARAAQLETITSDLAGATNRETVARVVVDSLIPAVGADQGSLFVTEEPDGTLRALAIRGYNQLQAAGDIVLPLQGRNGPADTIRAGTPLILDGPEDFARRWPHLAQRFGTDDIPQTSVTLPLIVDGKPIGTIGIGFTERHVLTEDEMRHLTIMAGLCAQALGRAMAFEKSESAQQRLRAVDQISDAALSRLSLTDLLEELPGRIASALGCDAVRIFLTDEAGEYLEVRGQHGSPGDDLARVPVGRGLAGTIAASGRPRVIEDISQVEVITPAFPDHVVSEAGVPLRSGGRVIGVLDVGAGPQRPLTPDDVELLELAAERIAAAIDRGHAYELERAARRQSDLMARLAEVVNRPDTLQRHLDQLTRLIQEFLADCCLAVVGTDDDQPIVSCAHADPARRAAMREVMAGYVPGVLSLMSEVMGDGRSRSVSGLEGRLSSGDPKMAALVETLELTDLLLVPVGGVASPSGVLMLGRTSGDSFNPSEMALVEDYASRVGAALEARLAFERLRNTAMTLQRSLLPDQIPTIAGLELAARYWPASETSEVGGDFYDVLPLGDDRWGVIVGDVSGKGVAAAAMTGIARHTARAAARHGIGPVEVLRWVHEAFHDQAAATEVFCTAVFGILERTAAGFRFQFAVGGHPLPILRLRDGTCCHVGRPGTVLGLVDQVWLTETEIALEPGDWLVIYTDGVTDVPVANAITEDELLEIVRTACRSDSDKALTELDRVLSDRYRDAHSRDDTAVLVIRCVSDGSGGPQ